MVLALVSDLFFSARIRETARTLGVPLDVVKTGAELCARAGAGGVTLAIVDGNLRGDDPLDAVRRLKAAPGAPPVVAFMHDAAEERMIDADRAGCDRVLSRGQLTRELPSLLRNQSG